MPDPPVPALDYNCSVCSMTGFLHIMVPHDEFVLEQGTDKLTGYRFGTVIALLFIGAMACTGLGFAIFLHETRLGVRSIKVRAQILTHEPVDEDD